MKNSILFYVAEGNVNSGTTLENSWVILNMLNIKLPYDTAIPRYISKSNGNKNPTKTHAQVFIEPLFTISKKW